MILESEWLIADSAVQIVETLQELSLKGGAPDGFTASTARSLEVEGRRAKLNVRGVLLPEANEMLDYFGVQYSSYDRIAEQIAAADSSANVDAIDISFDSPGGALKGFFSAARAIAGAKKPVTAYVNNAASGAYGLASQAGKIIATAPESTVGSVGVVTTVRHPNSNYATTITSTAAPDKVPDPTTDRGVQVIRKQLDDAHALFVGTIADGRGVTPDAINSGYGGGAVFYAAEALSRGMIDQVLAADGGEEKTTAGAKAPAKTSRFVMDLETLKAEHAAVYREAVSSGSAEERKRCSDHLKLGKESGAMDVAYKAIESGASVADCQAEYLSAAINKIDVQRMRGADSEVAMADTASAEAAKAAAVKPEDDSAFDEFTAGLSGASAGKVIE